MQKIIQNFGRMVLISVLVFAFHFCLADGESVNVLIKNNRVEVGSAVVPLPSAGVALLSGSDGEPHEIDARSVLNILNLADVSSGGFQISNLIYYSSFNAFYLKCMEVSGEDLCDDWQYDIDGDSPAVGMGDSILSGGETVTVFFGSADVEETTPEPELEPEPEETPKSHGSSGSRVSGSMPVVSDTEEEVAKLSPVEELPKIEPTVEVPKTEQVVPVKKVIPVKKVDEIKKPVVQNTATVINAVDPIVEQSEPEQGGWFSRFLGWLFGF